MPAREFRRKTENVDFHREKTAFRTDPNGGNRTEIDPQAPDLSGFQNSGVRSGLVDFNEPKRKRTFLAIFDKKKTDYATSITAKPPQKYQEGRGSYRVFKILGWKTQNMFRPKTGVNIFDFLMRKNTFRTTHNGETPVKIDRKTPDL